MAEHSRAAADSRPHVVIIGGGFGGLEAAKALAGAKLRVTLVDRRNHHVFQPLLYQVATAALNPANIASPIRRIFRGSTTSRSCSARSRRSTSRTGRSGSPTASSITTT